MRKFWITAFVVLFPMAVLGQSAAEISAEADSDRGFLTGLLESNLSGEGRQVVIEGFQGALSSRATFTELRISDEDGAYLVAEGFRKSLAAGRIPHLASERGYVTASVGVATYSADNLHRSAREIIQAADEALYSAKAAGRDRVFGTRVSGVRRRYASE